MPQASETNLTWTNAPNRRYVIEVSTDPGVSDPWHKSALDHRVMFFAGRPGRWSHATLPPGKSVRLKTRNHHPTKVGPTEVLFPDFQNPDTSITDARRIEDIESQTTIKS